MHGRTMLAGWIAAMVLVLGAKASASEPAPISLHVRAARAGEAPTTADARYVFVVELRSEGPMPASLVADRRWLSFEVQRARPRQRLRCAHPRASVAVGEDARRIDSFDPASGALWREWIDLRMYCAGRALDAAEAGAPIVARYAPPSRRGAELARYATRTPPPREVRSGTPIVLPARSGEATATPETPVSVTMADVTSADGRSMRWSVRVDGHGERRYVYLRPEFFRFEVRGPLGNAACAMPRSNAAPIRDLFRRFGRGARRAFVLEARSFCPDAFRVEGVYEVLPTVDLAIDGRTFELDAWSGSFHGAPAVIRVTRGERDAYLEQVLVRAGGTP